MRPHQKPSPRGGNGDRSRVSKAKEKKEPKEAAGKAKDDKVSSREASERARCFLFQTITFILPVVCIADQTVPLCWLFIQGCPVIPVFLQICRVTE